MINYSPINGSFISIWSKYRPAILKLMIDSAGGPQQYKFSEHEFRRNSKEKGGFSFTLSVFMGKAVNNIKGLPIAKDLLEILQQSGKAAELAQTATYEFVLDKHFMLHVTRIENIPVEVAAEEPAASNGKKTA